MSLTIGLAGMDPATEAALKSAFTSANDRLSGRWQMLPETQADHIIVDMDSMYGPMSWLRLHAAGKRVVGLTSASRTQTDFRLGRPFSTDSLLDLLREIDGGDTGAGVADASPTPADAPAPDPVPAPEPAPAAPAPEPVVAATRPAAAPPPSEARPEPVAASGADIADTLFDWLAGNRLQGRVRYRRPNGPTLLVDAGAGTYHGPATLKPLAQYFEGSIDAGAFDALDNAAWDQESAAAGAPQPVARLRWLGALVAGKGRLLPGHDPEARYKLNRWPQTEREFPRHFRIATAMMKGPATLAEIAEASGVAADDVVDFVNANLATGIAEAVREPDAEPSQPAKGGGLLGRLRGR